MPHTLETRVLLDKAEDPRLATLQGYRDLVGGYSSMERAYKEMEQDQVLKELEDSACGAAAGPASRWAKRPPSSLAAKWPSTSAATPTSPSRVPSRTAS